MELILPTGLVVAIYVASAAIVVIAMGLIGGLLVIYKQIDRITRIVDALECDVKPLTEETKAVMKNLRELSLRARVQWEGLEEVLAKLRSWVDRTDRVVETVASVVETPVFALSRNVRKVQRGIEVFWSTFLHRNH